MSIPSQPNTFTIERIYATTPARVFRAFGDPEKKRRWYAEGDNHEVVQFEMQFEVGGSEHSTYRFKAGTPFAGVELSSVGVHLDVVPDLRIVLASTMAFAGNRISATLVTIELTPVENGTKLTCIHQGVFFEGADGPQIREAGWRKLFERLAVALDADAN